MLSTVHRRIPRRRPTPAALRPPVAAAAANRVVSIQVMALGFFAFIPYPALGVGNTSALQIGDVLSIVLALPLLTMRGVRGPLWIAAVLLAPLVTATIATGMIGEGDLSLAVKVLPTYLLPAITLVVVQVYAPYHALELLTGIAAGTVLHALVGAWQVYAFSAGNFPFAQLYVNQSFLTVQGNAWRIARYIQRPFGIFPEPSAMSSSLAPFVIFWIGYLAGLVRLRRDPAPWQRTLFAAAAAGGIALMLISRSGHAAIALAAIVPLGVVWLVRSRASLRTFAVIVLVFGAVAPFLAWSASVTLGERVGNRSMGNSSWDERSASLVIGFNLLVDGGVGQVIMGMGLGGTAPALWRVARVDAVFSVLLTYAYETGLIGALAIIAVGTHLARAWKAARFNLCFLMIFLTWLVGITVTTSYTQLLPLWVALAWMSIWADVCPAPASPPADYATTGATITSAPRRARPAGMKWRARGVAE